MAEPMKQSADEIVDCAELMTRLDYDTALLEEIVATFLGQSVDLVNDIKAAILQGDARKLQFSAHTLKGSARTLCAPATCEAAQILEEMGMNADLTHAGTAQAHLEAALLKMTQRLRTFCAQFSC
jgi:HPt (histidine-containing phosphotransfer) domain-containing protein